MFATMHYINQNMVNCCVVISLEKNGYPNGLINQNLLETEPVQFISKKQTSRSKSPAGFVSLTYVPRLIEKRKRILNNFNIKVGMKPANAIKHYFSRKDSTPLKLKKGVVYQINCEDCGQSYIGETRRSFSARCRKHMRDVDGWKPN